MLIDSRTGCLTLPTGLTVAPDLGRVAFLASPDAADAQPWVSHGPYASFRVSGGEIEGHPLSAVLFFFDDCVTQAQFGVSFYAPGAQGWDDWSAATEARAKAFQEDLLRADLGEPHAVGDRGAGGQGLARALGTTLRWAYAWGEVASLHDAKSASTYVIVAYAGRRERAYAEYQRWKEKKARLAALAAEAGHERPRRSVLSGLWRH